MKIGLIGLPSTGKTSLFNLLTGSEIEVSEFSTGKIEANIGIAKIPDERLDFLKAMYKPKKTTHATIEVIDVPGLVRGSSSGKGVGNQFLDNIRKTDVLVHVIRAFQNEHVLHADGSVDPMRDVETINMELLFADLAVIENRIGRIETSKKVTKENLEELEVLKKCRDGLEEGLLLHNIQLEDHERELLKTFSFLSEQPVIMVANIDEDQLTSGTYPGKDAMTALAAERGTPLIEICVKTELEINNLDDDDDKQSFIEELGIKESGIDLLSKTAYDYLGLVSFLTAGEDEVRAWPIRKGTIAKNAAGKIHSDIEKGFIRAEVCRFNDLKEHGSMHKAKEKGLVTLEGKEYVVQDGDIINFRFNV
jgi:GTP-binding protein YchF